MGQDRAATVRTTSTLAEAHSQALTLMVGRIRRFYSNTQRTVGVLLIDDLLQAFTLEPGKGGKPERIPAGNYPLALRHSPKFTPVYGHLMIEIMNVPGRSDVLFHPGVIEQHTLGCVLMGTHIDTDLDPTTDFARLSQSKDIYEKVVYPVLSKAIKESYADLLVEDADG